jgi:hypothetical protein
MIIETVDYPFLEEQNLKEYMRTLQEISNRDYVMIQCGQGSRQNYKTVHACDHAVKLIKTELDTLLNRKEIMMAELSKKYGKYDKDWVVDLAGGVHLLKAESEA